MQGNRKKVPALNNHLIINIKFSEMKEGNLLDAIQLIAQRHNHLGILLFQIEEAMNNLTPEEKKTPLGQTIQKIYSHANMVNKYNQ